MCFLIKMFFDDEKKNICMIDLLWQIEISLLNILKMFKNPGFYSKFQFFFKIS